MEKKAVIKEIRDRIKPVLKEMGFKTKGAHYVRVANGEMVQCFGFQGFLELRLVKKPVKI